MEALIPLLLPLIIRIIDEVSPATADEMMQKLNDAVSRRKAAVSRNEALDAPQDNQ